MANHNKKQVQFTGYRPKVGDIVRITRLHPMDAFSKSISTTKTVGVEFEINETLLVRPDGSCAFYAKKVVPEDKDLSNDFCFYAAYVEFVKVAE